MAKTSINVDEKVWEAAKEVFAELGMSVSAGVEIYLRQVVRDRALPFTPSLEPVSRLAEDEEVQR